MGRDRSDSHRTCPPPLSDRPAEHVLGRRRTARPGSAPAAREAARCADQRSRDQNAVSKDPATDSSGPLQGERPVFSTLLPCRGRRHDAASGQMQCISPRWFRSRHEGVYPLGRRHVDPVVRFAGSDGPIERGEGLRGDLVSDRSAEHAGSPLLTRHHKGFGLSGCLCLSSPGAGPGPDQERREARQSVARERPLRDGRRRREGVIVARASSEADEIRFGRPPGLEVPFRPCPQRCRKRTRESAFSHRWNRRCASSGDWAASDVASCCGRG
jgi:hypothetical protein